MDRLVEAIGLRRAWFSLVTRASSPTGQADSAPGNHRKRKGVEIGIGPHIFREICHPVDEGDGVAESVEAETLFERALRHGPARELLRRALELVVAKSWNRSASRTSPCAPLRSPSRRCVATYLPLHDGLTRPAPLARTAAWIPLLACAASPALVLVRLPSRGARLKLGSHRRPMSPALRDVARRLIEPAGELLRVDGARPGVGCPKSHLEIAAHHRHLLAARLRLVRQAS